MLTRWALGDDEDDDEEEDDDDGTKVGWSYLPKLFLPESWNWFPFPPLEDSLV